MAIGPWVVLCLLPASISLTQDDPPLFMNFLKPLSLQQSLIVISVVWSHEMQHRNPSSLP